MINWISTDTGYFPKDNEQKIITYIPYASCKWKDNGDGRYCVTAAHYDGERWISGGYYIENVVAWAEVEPYIPKPVSAEPVKTNRVYLSGPVTGYPDYLAEFAAAEKTLSDLGYCVVNPVKVNDTLPENTSYEEFMHVCFATMDLCDVIVMLPGWENSSGAGREKAQAEKLGMKILYFKDITPAPTGFRAN